MWPFGVWALNCTQIFVKWSAKLHPNSGQLLMMLEHFFLRIFLHFGLVSVLHNNNCCCCFTDLFTIYSLQNDEFALFFISPARHLYAASGASVAILWAHVVHKIQQFNNKTVFFFCDHYITYIMPMEVCPLCVHFSFY